MSYEVALGFLGLLIVPVIVALWILGVVTWIRMVWNMWILWRNVVPEVVQRNPLLKINKFNAIFYTKALNDTAKDARRRIFINMAFFIASVMLGIVSLDFLENAP